MSTLSVQTITGVINLDTPFQVTLNSAFGTANGGYNKANSSNIIATSAFNKANSALANATGTLAGDLTITGNLTVSSNTVSVNGQNVSPVQSFRNKIINGNFDFWQRGTSGTTNGYVDDRWSSIGVGSTFTTSRQSFTLGQTAVPNEPTYFHRTVVVSVAGSSNYSYISQVIESVRTLAGQTATLSFWAKADAAKNIAIEFIQKFGTGGSPSADVNTFGATCALTTSWQKFTVTVNIPSISGKTLGSNNNDFLGIYFWFDAGSNFNSRTNSLGQQSGTFDIAQVQFEAGSVATPFEMRPIGTELALCQRYYISSAGTFAYNANFYTTFAHPVTMRAAPTLSFSPSPSGGSSSGSVGFYAIHNGTTNFSYTASAEL